MLYSKYMIINSCDDANYVSTCIFTDRIATDAYFSPKMRLKLNALWQHSWHPSVTFSRKIVLIFKCNYDFGLRVYEENILGGRVIRTALGRLKGRHPFSKETSVYRVNALKLGGGCNICRNTESRSYSLWWADYVHRRPHGPLLYLCRCKIVNVQDRVFL